MTRANPKLGRPVVGDDSGKMTKVSFCLDEETERALVALEKRLDQSIVRGRRSVLLRDLIMTAFRKISD